MRFSLIFFLWLSVIIKVQAQHSSVKWYKGNTHTHSYWSDGDDFPEMIMDWYKSNGYNFVALSDHDILSNVDKWKTINSDSLHQQRFIEYLHKYGDKWVSYKKDAAGISVKLKTFKEYYSLFDEKDKFLIMQAEEISAGYKGKPVHIGVINLTKVIKAKTGTSVGDVIQNNLNQVYEQRDRTGQPMFAHLNHPNFVWGVTAEDMLNLNGLRFFEVYNGHPDVHNYGNESHPGTEKIWDRVLTNNIKAGKPLLYGLATDDAHHYLEHRVGRYNPGRGWIMVKAAELTPVSLIEAMDKGEFYATTGIELEDVTFKKGKLRIQIKPEKGVDYTIQFVGTKYSGKEGIVFKEVKGKQATYKLQKSDIYVRAKIISSKPKENPFQKGDVETAWTQPVTPSLVQGTN